MVACGIFMLRTFSRQIFWALATMAGEWTVVERYIGKQDSELLVGERELVPEDLLNVIDQVGHTVDGHPLGRGGDQDADRPPPAH